MKWFAPLFLVLLVGCVPASDTNTGVKGSSSIPLTGEECESIGGTWLSLSPSDDTLKYCRVVDAEACARTGGVMQAQGLLGEESCVYTYPDANKPCSSSDECLGRCVVNKEGSACKETTSPFGCFSYVGGPASCVD